MRLNCSLKSEVLGAWKEAAQPGLPFLSWSGLGASVLAFQFPGCRRHPSAAMGPSLPAARLPPLPGGSHREKPRGQHAPPAPARRRAQFDVANAATGAWFGPSLTRQPVVAAPGSPVPPSQLRCGPGAPSNAQSRAIPMETSCL